MSVKVKLLSVSNTPRLNNKAVDIPLAQLRKMKVNVKAYYIHRKHEEKEISSILNRLKDNVVAINITVYNYEEIIDCLNNYTERKNRIVIFGEYVTQFYKEIFEKCQAIDFAILGDLELPLAELIEKGFRRTDMNQYRNSVATPDDTDHKVASYNYDFVAPTFDYLTQLLPNRRKRLEYTLRTKNAVCTGKCTFCRSMKGPIVFRRIEDIVEEIRLAHTKYGVQKFFFTDDNILDGGEVAVQRLFQLCDLIIKNKLNVSLKCYFKATSCYTRDLLLKMRNAGFTTVFVGIESGSQDDLLLYNKLTTIQNNNQVLKDLKEAGIFPQIGFLTFNPYSTLNKLEQNYRFLIRHEIDDLFMWISSVRIFKYTPLYNMAKNDGLLLANEDYISYKSTYNLQDETAQKIYRFIMDHMYERVYRLPFDFEFLYGFYVDVLQTHPTVSEFQKPLLAIKESQLKRAKEFFHHLYVEGDLEYASSHYDEFLKSFENDQVALKEIYDKLLLTYLN